MACFNDTEASGLLRPEWNIGHFWQNERRPTRYQDTAYLNGNWVEVEAGGFMWLRAFCPQACYAGGPSRFRYLLYKDVNRHMTLTTKSLAGLAARG
ncbi:hypothetical protein FGD77_06025 [Roseovarius sp. M141]|nr:hypothetical protein [Roseovarius sp. M141]